MYTFSIILIVMAALLMVGVVLIQESKGGGLSSQFGEYKKLIGVKNTTTILERTTWVLAALIVVISVMCSYFIV